MHNAFNRGIPKHQEQEEPTASSVLASYSIYYVVYTFWKHQNLKPKAESQCSDLS